jgi:large subunit ribosomal protein L19
MSEDKKNTAAKAEKTEDKNIEIKPGMTVKVHEKIKEKNAKGVEKERIQIFEGIVLARKHNKEIGATITVRKVSNGIGVEKIFPLQSPVITKIEPVKQARVRRAKLGFLRTNKTRLKEVKL